MSPKLVTLLNDLVWMVAWSQDKSIKELAFAIADECAGSGTRDYNLAMCTHNDAEITVRKMSSGTAVMTITKVAQEPAPAILVVESQDKFGDFVADFPRAFLDTTEGMVAALSYIEGLRKDEESSVTTCTISRMVLDEATHTYQAQKGHLGKTDF